MKVPITAAVYRKKVEGLTFGKRMPQAVYIVSSVYMPDDLRAVIRWAHQAAGIDTWAGQFNILKLHRREFKLSLLAYPDFWTDPHPGLTESVMVDLGTGAVKRRHWPEDNPPILHRKETFLPPESGTWRVVFSRLTLQEEEAGLYEDPFRIGRRKPWEALLRRKRLQIVNHSLIKLCARDTAFRGCNAIA